MENSAIGKYKYSVTVHFQTVKFMPLCTIVVNANSYEEAEIEAKQILIDKYCIFDKPHKMIL